MGVTIDIKTIKIADIIVSEEFNCREKQQEWEIDSLVDSIQEHGCIVPICVSEDGDKFRLIAGFRRIKACQRLGLDIIRANILDDVSEETLRVVNLLENVERAQLNIVEEGMALKRMFPGLSLQEIGRRLHKGSDWVSDRLKVIELPEPMQKAAAVGILSPSYIGPLHALQDDPIRQRALFRQHTKRKRKSKKPSDVRTREDCIKLLVTCLESEVIGLGPRMLAWMSKMITTDELIGDLMKVKEHLKMKAIDAEVSI